MTTFYSTLRWLKLTKFSKAKLSRRILLLNQSKRKSEGKIESKYEEASFFVDERVPGTFTITDWAVGSMPTFRLL
jgi:hypothetical protein